MLFCSFSSNFDDYLHPSLCLTRVLLFLNLKLSSNIKLWNVTVCASRFPTIFAVVSLGLDF